MSQLVTELRARANARHSGENISPTAAVCLQAAERIEALEAALRPFAQIADHLTQSAHGPAWGFNGGVLEHEDFQRARATLASSETAGGTE